MTDGLLDKKYTLHPVLHEKEKIFIAIQLSTVAFPLKCLIFTVDEYPITIQYISVDPKLQLNIIPECIPRRN
jgi:hypothetical protein